MKFAACLIAFSLLASARMFSAEEAAIDITGTADPSKAIPVALTGFVGEVQAVLKFDLEVAGFVITNGDEAKFEVADNGSSASQVTGKVVERIGGAVKLNRSYSGVALRAQAHAFADDVVRLFGRQGIAQRKVAFKVERGGGNGEIYVADYDGANTVAMTRDGTTVAAPVWVPGRRMLFYTSYKSSYPRIYSHDLANGDRKEITPYSGLNTSPAVSPNGRRVAMILSKSGSPDLYVCNLDGTGLLQLTRTKEDESSPCWSPDGRTICFVSRENTHTPTLYTVPADGGAMRSLKTVGVAKATEPDWSPDGKFIVFTALFREFQIAVVPAAGGSAVLLTAGEDPVWAPNSRTVMFARRANGRRVLSLLDVPTKHVKDVKLNLGSASQPAWAK